MNLRRRLYVVVGVVAASAAVGAAAGLLVAGAMLATRLGHVRPSLLWELAALGGQSGALFGVLFGPPTVLGLLRRVPLNRLARDIFFGVTCGGVAGFALSLAFAQPRPAISLITIGSLAGFGLAAIRLWARFRDTRESGSARAAG